MRSTSPVATEVTSLFDDLEEVAQRVRERSDRELESAESAEGVGPGTADAQVRQASRVARAQAMADGARGLEKLAREPSVDLTPAEEIGVEAIVLLLARPALMVRSGDFADAGSLPAEWAVLDQHRQAIKASIARVGRIEVDGHPDLDWVGTGFMVAPDVVMTNRHVAATFARNDGSTWSFQAGRTCALDLLEEVGNPGQATFEVTDLIGVHGADDIDMALLRVSPAGPGGTLPTPLPLMPTQPEEVVGRPVYVIGYPAWDGRRNEPDEMRRIFMDTYDVKRLQPGVTTDGQPPEVTLGHDCSTLGGNSGSPVIDLTTHSVIGLHFGGRYRKGNVAVPLWRLADDPMATAAGLHFVG